MGDIPATLAALAGAAVKGSDGFDAWNYVVAGGESPRSEVPVNIDTCMGLALGGPPCSGIHFNALIQGRWKLIGGNRFLSAEQLFYDGWWSNDPYVRRAPNATQEPAKVNGV